MKKSIFEKRIVVIILALTATFLWGSAFPAIKLGYQYMHIDGMDTAAQILFAGTRFTLAGLLTILLGSFTQRKLLIPKKENGGRIFKLSLFQTVIQYVFFYIGLANASGVKCSIMEATNVFAALIISSLIFKLEKIDVKKVLGCIIGFSGVVLANLNGGNIDAGFHLMGEGFIIISAISSGFSSVFIKKYSEYEDPVILSGYQFVCGGLLMIICGLLFGGRITQPTGTGIMLLLWLAMVSAVAYSLWSILLKYNPVTRVAIFGFTNPIFGAFLSALFLGESDFLGVSAIVSLVLVSIGICMVNMTGKEDIQN